MSHLTRFTNLILFGLLYCGGVQVAEGQELSREEKLVRDRQRAESQGIWIYNDLDRGFATARETGKPMLVVLRCVPCEECVKLDDELVERDPEISRLLDSFVCVRQVSTNGLDLRTFQFDTDQSFAVFFLNADGTMYGRFGTRSHRTEWMGDVSIEAMAAAMKGALEIHANYPDNRTQLRGKQGDPVEVASPEQYPSLKDEYTSELRTGKDLVKSCIHCHQIGDAQRDLHWTGGKGIPEQVQFQYPHPKVVGLVMDPQSQSTIAEVAPDSPAERAGLRSGDQLVSMERQPLISIADIQWVLHQFPADGGELSAVVRRDGEDVPTNIRLDEGWRREDNISWRVSSWGMRRMVLGGLVLDSLSEQERREAGVPAETMALRVSHVGQYGAHATAKRQGFRKEDILISYDGRDDLERETDVLAYATANLRPGQRIQVGVWRDGRKQDLTLPIQP
jgi:hypothetical protein